MAKIHPKTCLSSSPPSSSSTSYMTSSSKETFTIWIKSLVFNGNGCTVYDANGKIIYRMDNYDQKQSSRVHLMDLKGNILFTILRKQKLNIFGCWEAYRYNGMEVEEGKPWFRVKKAYGSPCEVIIMAAGQSNKSCYHIEGCSGKVDYCKIVNQTGGLVAEVMQKQSGSGIALGEDVMKLVVEANVDHSLVMGIVIVYSLMNHRM